MNGQHRLHRGLEFVAPGIDFRVYRRGGDSGAARQRQPAGAALVGQDQDDFVLMPLSTLQRRISGNRDVGSIAVSAVSELATTKAKQQIEELMRERRRIAPGQADDFSVRDMKEVAETLQGVTGALTALRSRNRFIFYPS